MLNLTPETDAALIANDSNYLLLIFKIYGNLYRMQLPFIHNRKIYANFVESIQGSGPDAERLSEGSIDWFGMNQFFKKIANDLSDSL